MRKKRNVLVLTGWHDERVLGTFVRHAHEVGWYLETRHYFDETLPKGWVGDGMIVSQTCRPDLLEFMRQQAPRQPTVVIERNHPGLRAQGHVHEDNLGAGRLAAEHLLGAGHKNFAWWTSLRSEVTDERLAGFRETLAREGCACEILQYQTSGKPNEWQLRRKWLGRRLVKLPRPFALFAMDDQLAAEAIEMCLECGLNVPNDVAVVGVGNIALACGTSHVPITSVDIALDEIALAGARLLDILMDGGRGPDGPVIVPPRGIVRRQSTAALAVTHPLVLRAIEVLRADISKPYDIHRLTESCGVGARTIYYLFRSELRCSPVDFLQREQLEKAKTMLESRDVSIGELVGTCGFGTARTMNRLFQSQLGCSPKEWRQEASRGTTEPRRAKARP